MVAETIMPSFNQPSAIPPPQAQPTYPVQNGTTQYGPSGGLVNKAAQIQAGVQNGLNMGNQFQQMQRASQNYKEQQAAHAAQNESSAHPLPPPETQSQTGDGHSDFWHSVVNSAPAQAIMAGVHAIGNAISGGRSAIPPPQAGGQTAQQGPPAPAPAAAQQGPPAPAAAQQGPPAPAASPPAMMGGGVVQGAMQMLQDGGPVLDSNGNEIHKLTGWDLAKQAVSEVGEHLFGSGAGAKAADDSRRAVSGAQNQADIESKMAGGVIGKPSHMMGSQHGGGFGVSDAGIRGIQGFEGGGAIPPSPAAAAQAGAQNGMDMAQQSQQMTQANQQYSQGQNANAAMSGAAAPPAQQLAQVVENIHQDMLDHTLNDKGVPNKDAGIPNPAQAVATAGQTAQAPAQGGAPGPQAAATAQAAQTAQQNPAAQAGVPEDSPGSQGKPHSVPFDMWTKWDQNIDHAVQLSAQAGQDPGQVRAALEANRNAWVQGHVLRNLSAANVAWLNGDEKGVETALKNAYYYLPDGKNLTVQKDANGKLVYQDPINPKLPDGKPNMIPVDAAHIQMLGVAMLDTMNVQNTIMNVRSAQAKIMLEQSQARAAEDTGKGNYYRGLGIYQSGNAKEREVDANNYLHLATGDKERALASWWKTKVDEGASDGNGKLDPTLQRLGQQAGAEYDNVALGRQTIAPNQIPTMVNGKQVMVDNPQAGKPTRDTSQVPEALKNLTPEQHAANKATASDIALANNGQISPARAADLVTRMQTQRHMTHPGPDGKPQNDVLVDKNQGTGHVWDRQTGQWIDFKLHPNTAGNIKRGATPDPAEVMAAVASGQGTALPSPGGEAPDPEATAPDMTSPTGES